MDQLTQLLFVLSNSMLIPVMLLLIVCFVRVLVDSGKTIQEFLSRGQHAAARKRLETAASQVDLDGLSIEAQDYLSTVLCDLAQARGDVPRIAYLISQAELHWQRSIDRLKGLVKLGPALGLMGTLIPLGPALVGLAVGDIQTMSNNLVIAFSTTVIGLFVGMLAGYLVSTKKHWYQADASLLNFVAERLSSPVPVNETAQRRAMTASVSNIDAEKPEAFSSREAEVSHV